MSKQNTYLGEEYDIPVGVARVKIIMQAIGITKDVPKMGYEMDLVISDCRNYTLKVFNISGQFFIGCSNHLKSHWIELFKFNSETLTFIH